MPLFSTKVALLEKFQREKNVQHREKRSDRFRAKLVLCHDWLAGEKINCQ